MRPPLAGGDAGRIGGRLIHSERPKPLPLGLRERALEQGEHPAPGSLSQRFVVDGRIGRAPAVQRFVYLDLRRESGIGKRPTEHVLRLRLILVVVLGDLHRQVHVFIQQNARVQRLPIAAHRFGLPAVPIVAPPASAPRRQSQTPTIMIR